jgi:hypothetical protein
MEIWCFREDDFEDQQYDEHAALEGYSSTSFAASSCTITFTPSSTGDYLILASAISLGGNHATYRGEHKIVVDGVSKGTDAIKCGLAGPLGSRRNQYCYGYAEVLELDASSTTIEFQARKSGSGPGTYCGLESAAIAVLRMPVSAGVDELVSTTGVVGSRSKHSLATSPGR